MFGQLQDRFTKIFKIVKGHGKISENNIRIHNLGSFERVWVIGAVRGKAALFEKVCKQILDKSKSQDRLVFTGNLVGSNKNKTNESKKVINIAIKLRAFFMSNSSFDINDIVFLRGCFEELLDKSRELHMSPNPLELVEWMYSKGLDKVLESYKTGDALMIRIISNGNPRYEAFEIN